MNWIQFWRYWSQYLSHVYRELNSRDPVQFSFIIDYLNQSQLYLRDQLPPMTEGNQQFENVEYFDSNCCEK